MKAIMKITEWMLQRTIDGSTNLQALILVLLLIIAVYIAIKSIYELIKNYKEEKCI